MIDRKSAWKRSWLAAIVISGASIFMAGSVSSLVPVAPKLGFALGFAAISMLALWVAATVPWGDTRAKRLGPWLVAGSALVLLLLWALRIHERWAAPLVGSALLTVGSYLGATLGRRIEHPGHLLFVAWVSALADAVSVFHPQGPTHAVADSAQALSVLALPFALFGTPDTVPMLGIGDVIFLALYLSATRRHGLSVARTVLGLALGLTLTLCALLWWDAVVPALLPLGLGVLAMQPAARRPPQQQRAAALALASGLTVLVALMWLNAN